MSSYIDRIINDPDFALYTLAAVPVLWIGGKLVRKGLNVIFPSGVPGEPNTALLASVATSSKSEDSLEGATEYDYIIAGGGTAGCVLANRLSEDPNVSVLVIEAGNSDLKQLLSRIPVGFGQLFKSAADWDLKTVKQPNANNREMYWPRGKMLGGCSAINAMMYQRAAPEDYDEWENKYGCEGWSYSKIEKYFKKAEGFTQRERFTIDTIDEHGTNGPWQVSYSGIHDTTIDLVDAFDANGIRRIKDVNTRKGPIGAAPTPTFIDQKGQRSSTAVAYLTADVASRPNLKIATGQNVKRVLFANGKAAGVEMSASRFSPITYVAKARREVIVCGGAVHSPQLLKVSGVGPAEELKKFDIPVVRDLPGVGANLQDHLFVSLVAKTAWSNSLQFLAHPEKSLGAMYEWLTKGTGPMTTNVGEMYAFFKAVDLDSKFLNGKKVNDLSSGPNAPDLEVLSGPLCYINHGFTKPTHLEGCLSAGPILLRPESHGTINLVSSSIFDPPAIDPHALSTEQDRDILVAGCKFLHQVMKTKPYVDHITGWENIPENPTEEDWRKLVTETCETLYHPVGTVKMGPSSDKDAVVDARLRVHGIPNLRVVDASIMPRIVASHTCSPVVCIAEKAADMIKEDAKKN